MTRLFILLLCVALGQAAMALSLKELPGSLQAVLENTKPIATTLNGRLPLFVLPISGSLSSLPDGQAEKVLNDLAKRGIGYSVNWNHGSFDASLKEGLRIGELQQRLGRMVSVHATGCLYSFFDGTEKTQHIDAGGRPFGETSFGGTMGCPFALEHRIPVIRQRVEAFLKQYKAAGVDVDFIFADWEIGEFRGRKFSFPDVDGLRPTPGKIRETLFNWLQFDIINKTALDPFAGSGALSLEAISRGAKEVYVIEKDREVYEQLKSNFKLLDRSVEGAAVQPRCP